MLTLKTEDQDTRGEAIEALGNIRHPDAVTALIPLLHDRILYTARRITVQMDQATEEVKVVRKLIGNHIYETAVEALVKIGDQSAMAALTKFADSEADAEVRQVAKQALGKMAGRKAQ